MNLHVSKDRFQLTEVSSQELLTSIEEDVRQGLLEPPRSLPPKYFYDEYGSQLFKQICETKEYYPTRTEYELLEKHTQEIISTTNPQTCIELGAGASIKTEILLNEIISQTSESTFISIDVCKEVLIEAAERLLQKFKQLQVQSIAGEYLPAIQSIPNYSSPALFLFIGSSIGNFDEQEAIQLLTALSNKMQNEDYFLIGLDRVKDKSVLEHAYNDKEGITAKFNLNVLNVLNHHLQSNFKLENFSHVALYNEQLQQIEMYLQSKQEQQIDFPALNKSITLNKDEKILTEISRKYTRKSIQHLLNCSGLQELAHFEPENEYYSLVLTKRSKAV